MNNKKSLEMIRTMLISLSVVLILFIVPCFVGHLLFETNDDLFMKLILSGEYTGVPSPYVLHMNIVVGLIISLLYRIIPIIPFYTLFFIVILIISFSYILYITIKYIDNKKIIPWIIVCFCILFVFIFSEYLIEMQYTLTAGIAGACGIYGLFFLNFSDKRCYIRTAPILFLMAISFCIREKVFYMLLPFIVVILVKDSISKRIAINMAKFISILVAMVVFLFLINNLAYNSSDEWRDFKMFNTNRERIVDSYYVPNYEEYEGIYTELGITQSSYIAFVEHYYCTELDDSFNYLSLKKLGDVAKIDYDKLMKKPKLSLVSYIVVSYIVSQFNTDNVPISIIVHIMYMFSIYSAIILYRKEKRNNLEKKKSKYLAISIVSLLFCRSIIWTYMIIHGKILRRVSNGVLFIELLLLIALLIYYVPKVFKRKIIIGFVSFIIAISILLGLKKDTEIKKLSDLYYERTSIYDDIRHYTDEHRECIFLCDTYSFSYFINNDLNIEKKHEPNIIMLGGWTANSPWHKEIYRNNDIDNIIDEFVKGERVFFIVQRSDGDDIGYIKDFVDEATGEDNNIEIYDSILCGNDKVSAVYDIYKVYK